MTLLKNERIIGKRVYLREFSATDDQKVYFMSREAGMAKWIPDQVYEDLEETRQVLSFLMEQYRPAANPAAVPIVFAVVLSDNHELIGHVGLSPIEGGVEIGYAIESCRQNSGYASEAVRLVVDWAFKQFGLDSIYGIVAGENMASARVLEKAGFDFCERRVQPYHGKDTEVIIYRAHSR